MDDDHLKTLLRTRFGFDAFKPGQAEVIGHLLGGRSAAAVFPTGGGKSLCYQLPALELPGLTLVVSPLIALMKDQIDALAARGIAAARLDSSLSLDAYRQAADDARQGRLRLLYVSPERFNNERFLQFLDRTRVSLFAVDEAHCISEWGHNFRPDYLKLARFAKACRAERVLALTATATVEVLADICRFFEIDAACAVRTGFYRPNLRLLGTPVALAERDRLLLNRLAERPPGPSVVYVTLQRTAEQLAERLQAHGFVARPYHAGMEDDQRAAVQDWFLAADNGIVVATIAFGMGVDKPNIRAIYHYNPPKSLENYSQEIGRSGRDGLPSICEMFFCSEDLCTLENFVYGDTPTRSAVAELVRAVFASGEQFDVSYYDLSAAHDIKLLVVRTLMCYLELLGYVEAGTPYYASYQFRPNVSSAEILARFDGERREFLAKVLRQARKAKVWFTIDAQAAAKTIGSDRDRIVRALDYLSEQGWLELRPSDVRFRYRRLRTPANLDELIDKLHQRTQLHERREVARLEQVVEWLKLDGCQVAALGRHFGEDRQQPCGHCSWCLDGGRPADVPPRAARPIPESVWRDVALLRRTEGALIEPRRLARFLCGLSSPHLVRAKLTRHALFGALADVPFAEVLQRAASESAAEKHGI